MYFFRHGIRQVIPVSVCLLLVIVVVMPLSLMERAQAACPGDTQMEMNDCAAQDFDKADKRLNQAYKRLEKTPELIAAEKAWIAFRDAECKYQAQAVEGGSMQPMVYANCLQSLTENRIKQIQPAGEGQ